MNADLIRGIRGIREYPWFICPYLLWFDIVSINQMVGFCRASLYHSTTNQPEIL
jgi:hypothetical protein